MKDACPTKGAASRRRSSGPDQPPAIRRALNIVSALNLSRASKPKAMLAQNLDPRSIRALGTSCKMKDQCPIKKAASRRHSRGPDRPRTVRRALNIVSALNLRRASNPKAMLALKLVPSLIRAAPRKFLHEGSVSD